MTEVLAISLTVGVSWSMVCSILYRWEWRKPPMKAACRRDPSELISVYLDISREDVIVEEGWVKRCAADRVVSILVEELVMCSLNATNRPPRWRS